MVSLKSQIHAVKWEIIAYHGRRRLTFVCLVGIHHSLVHTAARAVKFIKVRTEACILLFVLAYKDFRRTHLRKDLDRYQR
jgi:hypothetical protein